MKDDATAAPSRQSAAGGTRDSSANEHGLAIAPPSYGIEFVDRGTIAANRTGMPDRLKAGIEALSGIDMSDVRVSTNSSRPAQLGALAYARGNEIHLGPGQEKHLPHEAWHAAQQRQGRVRPTTQRKDGVPLNEDRGLEREADLMGRRAVGMPVGRASTGGRKEKARSKILAPAAPAASSAPVQAIMSVAEFQAATPKGFLKPRATVTAIDQALGTYINTRTAVNANALVVAIQNYVAGNHDVARVAVANQLLARAQAEHSLLQQIGDPNSFLVDGLIEQASMARVPQLVQLATDVTAAHATVLPNLINTIGAANIWNLNNSGLVANAGPAHAALLAPMITQSGGVGELGRLNAIVARHVGQGNLAFDLTREAAGTAAIFARLAGEVPAFLQTAAPGAGALPGVAVAVGNYNAALAAALLAALNTLVAQATTAHAQATALGGVNAGLLLNVNTAIGNLQNHVNGGPPFTLVTATAARNIVFNALNGAVTARAGVLGVPVPAAFTAARAAADNAFIQAQGAANTSPIVAVNEDHFLTRHTAHYFDFAEIKPDNTQWNTAWGGNTVNNLGAAFVNVLNALFGAGTWLQPGVPLPNQAVGGGGTAQIAALAVVGGIRVGQFFPEHNPGANIYDHPDTTMRAIRKVV